ncbi:ead/Ea22-like family protein [Escherichia coli]|uniref:ead/Ea22-like family protein n=1 Tax=Escherichia coli TaxID=562 RepID=UPI0018EEFE53|nr:ead/Ea22-like family protein [Escherichia coli]EHQ9013015.1 ead/Ea22-like family protein [Escherichia coli]EHW7739563.1 ead/Ea22-like family protein [Escherichia coli]EIQ0013721.1 ead/Ea22-like family protein [Escherichia coli]EIZ4914351.1 ead/Ea22-like family protein [Escherichia coli]MBN6130755.1 ead/Ea22-like family protein [Escherichia coli]
MSKINYQVLRMAAENATPGEWCSDDYYGVIADAGLNANYYIASCSGPDNRANKRFIAAANPATVLALLDEREAAKKRIAELEAREVQLPTRYGLRYGHPINADERHVMIPKENGSWIYLADLEHVLRVAGIRIKGE